jgi:hypothetical protein
VLLGGVIGLIIVLHLCIICVFGVLCSALAKWGTVGTCLNGLDSEPTLIQGALVLVVPVVSVTYDLQRLLVLNGSVVGLHPFCIVGLVLFHMFPMSNDQW